MEYLSSIYILYMLCSDRYSIHLTNIWIQTLQDLAQFDKIRHSSLLVRLRFVFSHNIMDEWMVFSVFQAVKWIFLVVAIIF